MSYVQEVIQPGETLRFQTNVHWSVYWRAATALFIAFVFLVWFKTVEQPHVALLVLAAAFGMAAVILFVPAALKRFGTEIAVTNRRVIHKTGLLRRQTREINMEKVESVDVDQSILGRLFGYGSITVRGTGEAMDTLPNIAHPLEFRNAVMVR